MGDRNHEPDRPDQTTKNHEPRLSYGKKPLGRTVFDIFRPNDWAGKLGKHTGGVNGFRKKNRPYLPVLPEPTITRRKCGLKRLDHSTVLAVL
jgi:hypothetical protein